MRATLATATLSLLLSTAALTAQSNTLRFPQSYTGGSTGQIIPLGVLPSSANFDEGRWQQIVPANYLPSTGGLILGMEVLSQATLSTTYNRLAITMSMVPPGGALSTSFATNLPNPVPVYAHQIVTHNWVAQTWQLIPFDIPFVYDGVSDIVVDIQKAIDRTATPPTSLGHHQTDGDPGRNDLPIARDAFGAFGSGASSAAVATSSSGVVLKVGFQFADLPTFTLNGPRGGASGRIFPIGGSFTATLNGYSGMPYGSLISFGWAASPGTVPGIGGRLILDFGTLVAYDSGTLSGSGQASVVWSIPNVASLVGAHVAFQGVSLTSTASLVLTNGIDCVINS
ncbi:MAG: hypothetical protein U1F36_00205 [Planctomycetota bacterium]